MFKLSIVSPERVLYEDDVESLVAPGIDGYLGILSNHAPLITSLVTGRIEIRDAHKIEKIAAISQGFLEVSGNTATILADAVEFVEEIDLSRAESALKRAEERVNMDSGDIDLPRARNALIRARNRIKLVKQFKQMKK
ncbi:MAG TPA: ATP synthase F1 subunit epsilon [candidate division Zixibacteria bacterium]|nr:ATP synthase F1 subunit epsilon [candidate division Zixibacteria bacterium]HEQ99663.1 ATP synthase F1 subunit epsilon [candidate division Zixibacteria bacterium]